MAAAITLKSKENDEAFSSGVTSSQAAINEENNVENKK